jgi:hypothetical protein
MITTFQAIYVQGCRAPKCEVAVSSNPVRLYCAEHADGDQLFNAVTSAQVFLASYRINRALGFRGLA